MSWAYELKNQKEYYRHFNPINSKTYKSPAKVRFEAQEEMDKINIGDCVSITLEPSNPDSTEVQFLKITDFIMEWIGTAK